MTLAFPGQSGTLWEVMARDAFLDALGDTVDRVRILEKDPATLDETLKLACRLEAISKSSTPPGESFDDLGRRRARAAGSGESAQNDEAAQRVDRLESALDELRRELDRCRQENARL